MLDNLKIRRCIIVKCHLFFRQCIKRGQHILAGNTQVCYMRVEYWPANCITIILTSEDKMKTIIIKDQLSEGQKQFKAQLNAFKKPYILMFQAIDDNYNTLYKHQSLYNVTNWAYKHFDKVAQIEIYIKEL